MLWLLRGQEAHGGHQRTQGGAGDTPPGGVAAVAVLWGDLPLLTGIRPAASLLSFQPLPCGNHFYAKYFLSLVTLIFLRGGVGVRTGAASFGQRAPSSTCWWGGARPSLRCARTAAGAQASRDSLRAPRTGPRPPRGRPPLHSANTTETAHRATRR